MFEHSKQISIKEIDKEHVEKDNSFPVAQAFYVILSEVPDGIWQHYFEENWHGRLYSMKRNASVVGNKIRLVVAPGEEEGAINFLKQVIESTNSLIDKHNKRADIDQKVSKDQAEKDQNAQQNIKNKLKDIDLN